MGPFDRARSEVMASVTTIICDACGEKDSVVRSRLGLDLCKACVTGAKLDGIRWLAERWYALREGTDLNTLKALPHWGGE